MVFVIHLDTSTGTEESSSQINYNPHTKLCVAFNYLSDSCFILFVNFLNTNGTVHSLKNIKKKTNVASFRNICKRALLGWDTVTPDTVQKLRKLYPSLGGASVELGYN